MLHLSQPERSQKPINILSLFSISFIYIFDLIEFCLGSFFNYAQSYKILEYHS